MLEIITFIISKLVKYLKTKCRPTNIFKLLKELILLLFLDYE